MGGVVVVGGLAGWEEGGGMSGCDFRWYVVCCGCVDLYVHGCVRIICK